MAYLVFCLGIFISFTIFAVRSKQPVWWPAVVLVLPLAAPLLVHKSGKGKTALWAGITFGGLALAMAAETYLYLDYKERHKYSHLPPVVREMIELNEQVEASTIALYHASGKLDSLGLVQSRITDIRTTLSLIEKMREMIRENQADIDNLLSYIDRHQDYIRRQHLDWAFWISRFYRDQVVVQHQQSRDRYFKAFEDLLQYTHDNFDRIMEDQSAQHMANYDAYYLRYRGIADSHNRYNRKRIDFQDQYVAAHPEVKPFLPGSHHLAPFKFWDRFSF